MGVNVLAAPTSQGASPVCASGATDDLSSGAVIRVLEPAPSDGRASNGCHPPRKSARLASRPNLGTLDRAKQRKVRLLEGAPAADFSGSPAYAGSPPRLQGRSSFDLSALCGVSLSPGDVRNLEENLASIF